MKIFENILLDIFIGILLKQPWKTDRNSAEQWKYITTFKFLLRQVNHKHRFESPDITRLAQLLFPKLLVAYRTTVGDNGYTIYYRPIPTQASQAYESLAPSICSRLLLLWHSCISAEIQNDVSC